MNIPIFLMLQQSRNKPTFTSSDDPKAKPKNFDKICEKAKVSKTNYCIHCIHYYQCCVGSPRGICRGYNPNVE